MPNEKSSASGPTGDEAILRALMLLARPSCRAVAVDSGGAFEVYAAGEGGGPSGVIGEAAWSFLAAHALVRPEGGEEAGFVLTRAGVVHLRRLKSSPVAVSTTKAARPREAAAHPRLDPAESPIGWLARRRDKDGQPLLSPAQVDAAERLRADLFFAGLTPRVTTAWGGAGGGGGRRSAPGAGVELQDAVVAARERVSRALGAVGPEFAGLLIDVCGHLKGLESVERASGWPQRSARIVLGLALTSLARHYGFERGPRPSHADRNRIRHWGGEGYRPSLDIQESEGTEASAG